MTSKGYTGKKCPRVRTMGLYLEAKLLTENGHTIIKACELVGLSVSAFNRTRKYLEKK